MEKYYRFAGVEIAVIMPDEKMYEKERHLCHFRVDEVKNPHRFVFEMVETMDPPVGTFVSDSLDMHIYRDGEGETRYIGVVSDCWEDADLRIESYGNEHWGQCPKKTFPGKIMVETVLNTLGAEHLVVRAGGFFFHCAYIEWEKGAILFSAPSGTGKSTQADLWHQYRGAEIINGDRAVIRQVDGSLMAEGVPFAGMSQYCVNKSLPIRAIVYLSQAEETSIRRLRGYEAFSRIWEGVSVNTWDRIDMELVSEMVQKVALQVPVFYMPCTPDESAIVALEDALRKLA